MRTYSGLREPAARYRGKRASAPLGLAHTLERLGVGLHVHELAALIIAFRPRAGDGILDLRPGLHRALALIVASRLVLRHLPSPVRSGKPCAIRSAMVNRTCDRLCVNSQAFKSDDHVRRLAAVLQP